MSDEELGQTIHNSCECGDAAGWYAAEAWRRYDDSQNTVLKQKQELDNKEEECRELQKKYDYLVADAKTLLSFLKT